jgi:ferritin
MINKKVEKALNDQILVEAESSHTCSVWQNHTQ